jgi:hypothetical protein
MASTYSTNLALELIGTGDQAGTWGNTTNTNLGTLLEQAISGYVTQAVSTGTDTTITIPNGATGVARNMFIELTGTGGTNTNLIVPANKKLYFIFNNTSGAVTVKVTGQTGVSVPAGKKMVLVSNGTDVVDGLNYIADFSTNSFTVTNLTATSGTVTTLTSTSANITTLTGTSANITTLTGTSMNVTTATHASASITTLTGTSATVTNLLDGKGFVRNIPPASASKNAAYTLEVGDNGTFILTTSGTITVPNNTFAAGNVVSVFNNSASAISLTLSTTNAYVGGTNTNRTGMTLSTRGVCTVLFVNPSLCVVTGNVL